MDASNVESAFQNILTGESLAVLRFMKWQGLMGFTYAVQRSTELYLARRSSLLPIRSSPRVVRPSRLRPP